MRSSSENYSFYKVRWLILGWIFLMPLLSSAQQQVPQQLKFPSDYWNQGKVVLEAGDTLKGLIKYNMQSDLVQLQYAGRLETYTPRKIVFVEIFDQLVKRYRQFYSLPYAIEGQYKAPVFFELLEEGKMTLLYRESLEYKTYSSAYYYGGYSRLVLVDKYFFLKDNGVIVPFSGKKSDFYAMMGPREDDVKKYAKDNKLNWEHKYGLSAIVHYYNSLVK